MSGDHKKETDYLLSIIEHVGKYRKKQLNEADSERLRETSKAFYKVFDELPYDEKLAFASLLMATEVVHMDQARSLIQRAEDHETVRKLNEGYVGLTDPYTPVHIRATAEGY